MTATTTNTPRRSRRLRRTALVAAVAAAGLLLSACGGEDMDGMDHGKSGSSASAGAPAGGKNPAPGAFNDADVMFAQTMIPHHEQALDMAALADGRAADDEIEKLAAEIAGAQDPEIRKMRSWLTAWGKPESADEMSGMDHGSGSSHGSGMAGMLSDEDMAELKKARGADFDRAFARLMVEHHKGAVDMAEDERKNGRNATAKKLADEVVAAQSAEIDRFEKILDRL